MILVFIPQTVSRNYYKSIDSFSSHVPESSRRHQNRRYTHQRAISRFPRSIPRNTMPQPKQSELEKTSPAQRRPNTHHSVLEHHTRKKEIKTKSLRTDFIDYIFNYIFTADFKTIILDCTIDHCVILFVIHMRLLQCRRIWFSSDKTHFSRRIIVLWHGWTVQKPISVEKNASKIFF